MATFLKESYFNGTNGSHFKQSLYYTVSQNVAKNTSTITYYGYVGSVDNYSGSGVAATVYINGSAVGSFTSLPAHSSGTLRGTKTVTVTHNNDGTKSVSYSMTTVTRWSLGDSSLSGTLTLPRIKRFATITNSPSSLNDESNPWFSFSNPAGASMSCWLEVNPNSTHLATRTLSGGSGTYTWNLTAEERAQLRQQMRTSTTGKIRIGLYSTIGGSTNASYVDRPFTIVNANPVFDNFDFEDVNPVTLALTGDSSVNINGFSNIRITIPEENKATAIKEATMSKPIGS